MKILLLNQFYPPDLAPTGRYLHDLARELVDRGHTVEVLASRRAYGGRERYPRRMLLDGVRVRRVGGGGTRRGRLLLKGLDYLCYWAAAGAFLLRRPAPDAAVVLTTPPYLGLAARLALPRQARLVHWIMDLYPDALVAHGLLTPGRPLLKLLERLAHLQFRGAAAVIALGPDMAARLRRYAGAAPLEDIPLWLPDDLAGARDADGSGLRAARGWSDDTLVLLYSGNMGLGHRFGEFLAAARDTPGDGRTRWVFAGDGKRRDEVAAAVRAHPDAPIELAPYAAADGLAEHLAAADVHLVSLDPAWCGIIQPSKVQAACAVGRPLLYVGPPASSLARWITESAAGWVCAEGDLAALRAAVEEARDPVERRRRGAAAAGLGVRLFNRGTAVRRLADAVCGS